MPTPEQIQQAIQRVTNQRSFIDVLLRETLDWPINLDFENIGDITYEWTDEELNTVGLTRNVLSGPVLQMQSLEQEREQRWGIFILEFANVAPLVTGRGLTGPLRNVLRGLVPKRRGQQNLRAWDRENLLFICTHNYQHFRFAYFKAPKEQGRAEPLTTFGWEPGLPPRTVCEFNLDHLCWPEDPSDVDNWVAEWTKAFDVEKVTRQFYEDYEDAFQILEGQVQGFGTDEAGQENRRLFVQTLMNRLMFLRFVERKGWLRFGEDATAPQDYLRRLFAAGPIGNQSWYNSRLKALFFQGLAVQDHQLIDIVGQVPYLNGGLFERDERDGQVTDVPSEAFEPILGEDGLFYRYNFTVEESTPLDIDVAVDPEMLGKVFEKLTNARRQKGSYYTPRTVVSFMCRETLKGYIGAYYAPLIDEDSVERIGIPEARDLLGRLADVRIVDPACGSGAYLLGMMHELFRITRLLDTRAETETPHDAYHRKLTTIQNNLYGVDIDEFAINIARLRLWLSLAVEFEGDTPEPLPNLDLKIECGDSLTAPDPSGAGQMDFIRQQQIRDLANLKAIHMNPRLRARRPGLENEIAELKRQIAIYAHPDENIEGFDWRVEFAEVWSERGGFDIVLANPPYGVDVDDFIRNKYFNQRNETERGQSKDSYGIFLARGLQLLRLNGTLSYIVSDTWRTIKSHRPLRKRLLDTTTVFHVLDLPSWIFDATVNTGVITVQKLAPEEDHKLVAGDLRAIPNGNWKMLSDNLIAISGHGPDIQTDTYARYTYPQILISSYANLSFFVASPHLYRMMSNTDLTRFGDIGAAVHGISTGKNKKYIRCEPGAGNKFPLIGDSMKMSPAEIAALTEEQKVNGVDKNWRALEGCFIPFEKGESSDAGEGWLPNYYVPTKYYINWAKEAIADMQTNPGFAWKNERYFFKTGLTFSISGVYAPTFRLNSGGVFEAKGSGIFCDSMDLEVLLGLFCSMVARYQFKSYIKHSVDTSGDNINEFRFPLPDLPLVARIKEHVGSIITKQKAQQDYPYHLHEQKEIDSLVFQLYGLNEEDIREIELWYCRRYSKLAEAQGLLAEVKEKYAAHLERCKRILEKPPSYWRSNPVLQLIAQGEGHTLEFKESLFVNSQTGNVDDGVFHSSLKTIAAYLNTNGGTLLIGVHDSGEIKGIDRDIRASGRGRNRDSFELKLRNVLSGDNSRFAPIALGHCQISYEELAEGTICKVYVTPMPREEIAHLDGDVFVRDGNRTIQLTGPDLTRWIQQRPGL